MLLICSCQFNSWNPETQRRAAHLPEKMKKCASELQLEAFIRADAVAGPNEPSCRPLTGCLDEPRGSSASSGVFSPVTGRLPNIGFGYQVSTMSCQTISFSGCNPLLCFVTRITKFPRVWSRRTPSIQAATTTCGGPGASVRRNQRRRPRSSGRGRSSLLVGNKQPFSR
jgi:hypothetical protein